MLVRVGADVTGLRKGLKSAQKDVQYFGRNVTGSLKEMRRNITGIAAGIGAGFIVKSGIQDAQRYEALMATLGESMGASRKEFEEWQETAGNAFGFSRLQAADTANLLSLNFKQIATDQADLVDKTTKMMEMAAIVSNKRGITMQETSDRIRSAMNQEADGADELGVNVRIAAVQMSTAYKEMADGQPWDKLTENMRKTILYHHILEQVNDRLGSTMQDTTALRMASFTASLADVRMALGQAFLPILYRVLPLLNTMAQALYKVLQVVAAFSRSLFGGGFVYKAPKGFADVANKDAEAVAGIGEAAEGAGSKSAKAAKKAEKAWKGLFGFDEVNTIKDPETPTAGGGGAGGGGAGGLGGLGGTDLDAPPMDFTAFEESIDKMARQMDKYTKPIKEAFKLAYDYISSYAKEKIAEISAWWSEHGGAVKTALNNVYGFIKPIFKSIGIFILDSVRMMVDGIINIFMGIVEFLSGVFTADWKMAWGGIKKIFFGVVETLFGFWNLTFIGGIKKLLLNFLKDGIKHFTKFVDDFKTAFNKGIKGVREYFKKLVSDIKILIKEAKDFIDGRVQLMETSFKKLWNKVEAGAKNAVTFIKEVFKGIVNWFARTIINPIVDEMERISEAFSEGIGTGFRYLMNRVIEGINDALRAFNRVKNGLPFGDKLPDLPTLSKIPALAQGGITNGPTLAMVGDNAGGREVISPLDKLESMLTNSVIQAMQLSGNNQNSGDVVLNIDGRNFARIVKPFLDREQNRVGSDVRIRTI